MTGSPAESGRLCTIFRTPAGRQRSTGGSRDETRHRLCQCPAPSVSVPRTHTAARPGSRFATLPRCRRKAMPGFPDPAMAFTSQALHAWSGGEHTLPHRKGGRAVSHASCTPPLPRPSACQSSHTPAGLHGSPSPDGVSPKK